MKFVHFLRKGFIKIITNISCLKAGEKEAEGQKAHDETGTADVLTYLMPNMKNIISYRRTDELPPARRPSCLADGERPRTRYWLFDLSLPPHLRSGWWEESVVDVSHVMEREKQEAEF